MYLDVPVEDETELRAWRKPQIKRRTDDQESG